jgi:AraC-like DNA-binding protein
MDPLSDVLSLLKPRSHVSSGFDAGGDWSVGFGDLRQRIKCYAVESGSGWLAVEGVAAPARLLAGDCFVLATGRPFRLASDLALDPTPAKALFPPREPGGIVTLNGGGDFFLVGSRFEVRGRSAATLMAMLPPIAHLRGVAEQTALRWAVDRMRWELREARPGGDLMAQHLAHMMLLQALRLQLAAGASGDAGWFRALADPRLGLAIRAMHADPARRWTVEALAAEAGMSRSSFAERFRLHAGESPIEYLTRWRMLLAGERLQASSEPVAAVAEALGYESESAFSAAFKRVLGCPPRRYRSGPAENGAATPP